MRSTALLSFLVALAAAPLQAQEHESDATTWELEGLRSAFCVQLPRAHEEHARARLARRALDLRVFRKRVPPRPESHGHFARGPRARTGGGTPHD